MKKKYIISLCLLVGVLCSACSRNEILETEYVSETVSDYATPTNVTDFKQSDEASYSLKINDSIIDMTPYVVSCENGETIVDFSILENEFGYIREQRKPTDTDDAAEPTMIEYKKEDGTFLQFENGGKSYLSSSGTLISATPFNNDNGKLTGNVESLFFAMGYTSIQQSRQGNLITYSLHY